MKGVAILFMSALVLSAMLAPLSYSISIKELISRYSFSASSQQINVLNHTDFMIDKDGNGINDTLVIQIATDNKNGQFIFAINLFDQYIVTNQTNISLNEGVNNLNITFSSIFLTQPEFNYSIKIYNSSYSLKYRKDKIPTGAYSGYEKGFEILDADDYKDGKTLIFNISINSSVNGTFDTALFLRYNDSTIFAKGPMPISESLNHIIYKLDNETLKRTHFSGRFNLTLKIGSRIFKLNDSGIYDFKDFAESSYISGFSDNGIDTDSDGKFDLLKVNVETGIMQQDTYSFVLALYDLFGSLIEAKNETFFMNSGNNIAAFNFNGSWIYSKKLSGPFIIKHIALYYNNTLVDVIDDAYTTNYYEFDDFDAPNLPDLNAAISASGGYHYGISNATINISFKNTGSRHAFNILTEFFDNKSMHYSNKSGIMNIDDEILYQISAENFSDFELSAIIDGQNFVEESDESNNGARLEIRLNHKPQLSQVNNTIINATGKIKINLSASDSDGDNLSFMINNSRFLGSSSLFGWNTTINDSGEYSLMATVSDGFLNDSKFFMITVLNISEAIADNDLDNDGIQDEMDKVIGNSSSVNTSTLKLALYVNGSANLSKYFNQTLKVRFLENNKIVLEFDFDFSNNILNLTNMSMNKQLPRQNGALLVRGLNIYGSTKTAYVDRANRRMSNVCIKNKEISSISEISPRCNKKDEYKVNCNFLRFFRPRIPYRCFYIPSYGKFMVTGLNHSGIIQV